MTYLSNTLANLDILKGVKKAISFLPLILILFLFNSNVKAQSMGKGAVSYIGEIDGIYFSISGDIKFSRYVMRNNQAEIQVKWNWLKVNYIIVDGVQYDQLNNPMNANFGNLTSDFVGEILIKTYIPTKILVQSATLNVYAGSTQNFIYQMDKITWDRYSMEERASFREKWENGPFISDVNLNSVSGGAIESIKYKALQHHKKLEKEQAQDESAEQKEKNFYELMEKGSFAEYSHDYSSAIASYTKALQLNIDNERANKAIAAAQERKERQEKAEANENSNETGGSSSKVDEEKTQSKDEKKTQDKEEETKKEEEQEDDS